MKKRIALFINPFATKPKVRLISEKVEAVLKERNLDFKVFGSTYPSKEELDLFTDCIIIGGDGTLNFVLNAFPSVNIPLGIIAAGTGNDFARKLSGIKTLDEQIEIALNGTVKEIDIGCCNGRIFLNGLGIGFDGKVAEAMQKKRYFSGKAAYYAKVLPLIFSYRSSEINITADNFSATVHGMMITIANGSFFGGGFHITPLADLQDGLLDVCLVKAIPVYKRLIHLPSIEKGKHLDLSFIEYFQTRKIMIETFSPLPAHLDGEFFLSERFDISLIGKKLFRTDC